MTRTLFILRDSRYFITHRLALARMLRDQGHKILVLCDRSDETSWQSLQREGFSLREVPFQARKGSPFRLFQCFLQVGIHFLKFKPNYLFTITVLSTLMGGFWNRIGRSQHIALIAGLGTLFRSHDLKIRVLRPFVVLFYRAALRCKSTRVIFQNGADRQDFLDFGICKAENAVIIPGSGVNTDQFPFRPYPLETKRPRRVGLVARMLRDKGVYEFIQASRYVKSQGREVEFVLIGGTDPSNPTSLTEEELEQMARDGLTWLGHQNNVAAVLGTLDIFCLPSYHEGFPKSLLEAASAGCALIVSDIPGCTAFVENEITGLTVPKQDHASLAAAVIRLLDHPREAQRLSSEARKKLELGFTDHIILKDYQRLFSADNRH